MTRRPSVDEKARKTLLDRRTFYSSWSAVSEELGGINKGYLNAVARGKKKASNSLLIALGLPPRDAVVSVCQKCGKAHEMLKQCGPRKTRSTPTTPRRNWKRLATWAAAVLMNMPRADIRA